MNNNNSFFKQFLFINLKTIMSKKINPIMEEEIIINRIIIHKKKIGIEMIEKIDKRMYKKVKNLNPKSNTEIFNQNKNFKLIKHVSHR